MKFYEYIIDRLQNNEEQLHIIFYGQGGAGKTYNFYELSSKLLETDITYNGKKVIPVYVPLWEYGSRSGEKRRTFIREYFWKNYFPQQRLEENTLDNLKSLIFNAPKCDYHFLFLCDGLNEVYENGGLIGELKLMAGLRNVSLIVSSREDVKGLPDSWKRLCLKPLTKDQVEDCIHAKSLSETEWELLRVPFYLSKYMEMQEAHVELAAGLTSYSLMENYTDWTIEKLLSGNQHNEYYEDRLRWLSKVFVTRVAFCMSKYKEAALKSDVEPEQSLALKEVWSRCGATCSRKMGYTQLDEESEQDLKEEIFEKYLEPMGIIRKQGNSYVFAHDFYRDFYAAVYMHRNKNKFESDAAGHQISKDILEFFSAGFASKNLLYQYAHEVNERIGQDEVLKKEPYLNANVVNLFMCAGDTIDGEDFSNRDLTEIQFDWGSNILNCNFRNSEFAPGFFGTNVGKEAVQAVLSNDELGIIAVVFSNCVFVYSCDDLSLKKVYHFKNESKAQVLCELYKDGVLLLLIQHIGSIILIDLNRNVKKTISLKGEFCVEEDAGYREITDVQKEGNILCILTVYQALYLYDIRSDELQLIATQAVGMGIVDKYIVAFLEKSVTIFTMAGIQEGDIDYIKDFDGEDGIENAAGEYLSNFPSEFLCGSRSLYDNSYKRIVAGNCLQQRGIMAEKYLCFVVTKKYYVLVTKQCVIRKDFTSGELKVRFIDDICFASCVPSTTQILLIGYDGSIELFDYLEFRQLDECTEIGSRGYPRTVKYEKNRIELIYPDKVWELSCKEGKLACKDCKELEKREDICCWLNDKYVIQKLPERSENWREGYTHMLQNASIYLSDFYTSKEFIVNKGAKFCDYYDSKVRENRLIRFGICDRTANNQREIAYDIKNSKIVWLEDDDKQGVNFQDIKALFQNKFAEIQEYEDCCIGISEKMNSYTMIKRMEKGYCLNDRKEIKLGESFHDVLLFKEAPVLLGWQRFKKEFTMIELAEKPKSMIKFEFDDSVDKRNLKRVFDKRVRSYAENKFCWSVSKPKRKSCICVYDEISGSLYYRVANNLVAWDGNNIAVYEFEPNNALTCCVDYEGGYVEIINNDLCIAYTPGKITLFTEKDSCDLFPFYLNIAGSDFNGVQLSKSDQQLLSSYGAADFEAEKLFSESQIKETLKATLLWKNDPESDVPKELFWTWDTII